MIENNAIYPCCLENQTYSIRYDYCYNHKQLSKYSKTADDLFGCKFIDVNWN